MSTKQWQQANKERIAAHSRAYYQRNKEACKAASRKRKLRAAEWLKNYKATLSCIRCGENHPACLQFHHRNPNEKKADLGLAVGNGWNIERIMKEIEKCDVLCANCHLKEHYAHLGHRKNRNQQG
jgi:hypothetical protein